LRTLIVKKSSGLESYEAETDEEFNRLGESHPDG
jgi:hypothetical protein